jgi:hypothetical protein
MVPRRMVVMSWFCLVILAYPAWAGQALLVKGMEAQQAGRNAEALKLLNEYVDRYPQIKEARYYRALALNGLGRQKEALEDVDAALADNPGNVSALLLKGNILVALERRPEAILAAAGRRRSLSMAQMPTAGPRARSGPSSGASAPMACFIRELSRPKDVLAAR